MLKQSLVLQIAVLLIVTGVQAQCDKSGVLGLYSQCTGVSDNYTLTKSLDFNNSMFKYGGEQLEYKYMFTKGSTYLISICPDDMGHDNLVVEVYNRNKNLVASSFVKSRNKFYKKIFFPCSASGSYYLRYYYKNKKPSCAVSVVAVKNKALELKK
ncbi:MAG: hypothetical protein MRY83_08295 [Flavobacteriales bacterium]|nr:hypothetical protein [Flavobacteriales bacterium]